MPVPKGTRYKDQHLALGYKLTNNDEVEDFIASIRAWMTRCNHRRAALKGHGKSYDNAMQITVSVVLGREIVQPLVDMEWGAAAMPCSLKTFSYQAGRLKKELHPPIYKRVKHKTGCALIRLFTMDDLRKIRGAILTGPGRKHMIDTGEILDNEAWINERRTPRRANKGYDRRPQAGEQDRPRHVPVVPGGIPEPQKRPGPKVAS